MTGRYDAIVIGGGINGTGTARDLCLRGLKVLLCEKGDLGAATTGNSSGMIHGGLRYLLSEVETTRLSCIDSGYIQRLAPHLLFRIPFLLPLMPKTGFPGAELFNWVLHNGMEVYFETYDRFQVHKRGKPSCRLSAAELRQVEPGITPDAVGAVTMDEWGIDPYRICLAGALDLIERGSAVLTYTKVLELLRENGAAIGVAVRDELTGEQREIRARAVVNAAGPWVPGVAGLGGGRIRLRPAKGIHLFYAHRLSNMAVVAEAVDGRQVFVMPYQNGSMIGTTDDDYYGDPDDAQATRDEAHYLLEAVASVLPGIRRFPCIGTAAGVRPTLWDYGPNEDDLSRSHRIWDHATDGARGFFSIAGGKLASFRAMSEDLAGRVSRYLGNSEPCQTHRLPLPGGDGAPPAKNLAAAYGVPALAVERLIYRHGSRAARVLELLRAEPRYGAVVCSCEPVLEAEIRYICRHEPLRRLDDLRRRCRLGIGACGAAHCALRAAQIFAEEKNLTAVRMWEELAHFLEGRFRDKAPILAGQQLAAEQLNVERHFGVLRLHETGGP